MEIEKRKSRARSGVLIDASDRVPDLKQAPLRRDVKV